MSKRTEYLIKVGLMVLIWAVWWGAYNAQLSYTANLVVIFGGVALSVPFAWLGRLVLDRQHAVSGVNWTTTIVHLGLGFLWGIPILRAILTHEDWSGQPLPIPPAVGLALVILSGAAFALTVLNLALKGSGAPFFIALSERVAVDWLYAWTRNPMVLAALALLLSLGLLFQSLPFLAWALFFFSPALLFFEKVYEERELELRFGAAYLEYKAKTPFLIPRRRKD